MISSNPGVIPTGFNLVKTQPTTLQKQCEQEWQPEEGPEGGWARHRPHPAVHTEPAASATRCLLLHP